MKWLWVVVGALIGAAVGEFPGAVLGAILGAVLPGWIDKRRQTNPSPGATPTSADAETPASSALPLAQRVAALEREIAVLRARMDAIAGPASAIPAAPVADVARDGTAALAEVSAAPAGEAPAPTPASMAEAIAAREAIEGGHPTPLSAATNPPAPSPPSVAARAIDSARAWLFGGNTVARVGILVLLVGLSFLAKYAADLGLFPPSARVIAIAAIAVCLLALGWRLRDRRPGFAALLQGAAVAALYLDVFAAYRWLHLLPAAFAFGLSVALVAFSNLLAVRQDAPSLAVIGAAGGFAAPVLMSSGQGSHVALFSYLLLLDIGIAVVALRRSWRVLYLLGFVGTFVLGGLWGHEAYRPEHYQTVQPFLAAFVLLFLAIVIIESRKTPTRLARAIDGTLVFGPPIVGFASQLALVRDIPWGSAWSAVAFGAVYVLAGAATRALSGLGPVFLVIGAAFLTLAIPLGFDNRVTSAAWALEGAGVLWFGLRHGRWTAVATGTALQLVAAVLLLIHLDTLTTTTPLLNARWIGVVLIAGAALFSARSLASAHLPDHPRVSNALRRWLSPALLAWAGLWWLGGHLAEFDAWTALTDPQRITAMLLTLSITAAGLQFARQRLAWPHAAHAAQALLPLLALTALAQSDLARHPSEAFAGLAWLLALVVHHRLMRAEADWARPWWLDANHIGSGVLAACLLAWQLSWLVRQLTAAAAWPLAAGGLVFAAMLGWVLWPPASRRPPIVARPRAYRPGAAMALAILSAGWLLVAAFLPDALRTGIAYLPLLNPVDLAIAANVLALVRWLGHGGEPTSPPGSASPPPGARWASALLAGVGFAALHGIVLRAVSRWSDVAYRFDALADSAVAQTSVSLLWSVCALAAMLGGARAANRTRWVVGAGLLALVVVKLFLVDSSNWGGLARIVSFLGVGALMLVIGYVAPIPPSARAEPGTRPATREDGP